MGTRHLQTHTFGPKGASSTEKMMNQALQPFAKKRHREGTAWPARVPPGFEWRPWRVRTIWLGGLVATWKADRQGVRIWGKARSLASFPGRRLVPASGLLLKVVPPPRTAPLLVSPHQVLSILLLQQSHNSVFPASAPICGCQVSLAGLGPPRDGD